jgi:phage tail-like protein
MPNGTENNESGQTGTWVDPFRAYNFKLEILGITEGHFTECGGLEARVDVIQYRQGGINQVVHRLPGQVDYGPITLRYGVTESTDLWKWFMSSVEGKVDRKPVSIVLMDIDGVTEKMRWNLINAWPSEWRGAPLDALGKEAAIESLTLVYEELKLG